MPLYTWYMAHSTAEKKKIGPSILLKGWKLSFPARPHIHPKELAEDQTDRLWTGSFSESWTPGESILIERRFQINHSKFLEQTGLPQETQIRVGVKWKVDGWSAAGFDGRIVTLTSGMETDETVSITMDGSRLGGTVDVSTPITLHTIPVGANPKALAAKENGQILWRGLDTFDDESPLKIKLQGQGSRFPISCFNREKDPVTYFVEWTHIPQGPIDFDTMQNFLERDPRTVFRVIVNNGNRLGKSLMGNSETKDDLARLCWAHEIAGMIAQKLFYICLRLDDEDDARFSAEDLRKMFNHSGEPTIGSILTKLIEVIKPGTMIGRIGHLGLKKSAEHYFTEPEAFVKAWQAKIFKGV
jgi:hypothetical protein